GALPARLVRPRAPLVGHFEGRLVVALHHEAHARLARLAAELRVVRLHRALVLRVERRVVGGHAEVRRALEHEETGGLLRDDGDGLDGGRASADHGDALAREVHALVRPVARVVPRALEALQAFELRLLRGGQAPRAHDAEARGDFVAGSRSEQPAIRRLVEDGRGDARLQRDVAAEIEAIGHVVDVFQDFRLGRVALRPAPLLLELVRERVGVVHALDIAAGAGVAVPVPRAPHALARLEDACGEAEAAQAVEHVEPCESRAHDDGVHGQLPFVRVYHGRSMPQAVAGLVWPVGWLAV